MQHDHHAAKIDESSVNDLVIVDDDIVFTTLLKRQLRHSNIAYEIFNDSAEALHFVQKNRPRILLVDLRMPVLDGVQLVKALSENHFAAPPKVILYSSCLPPPDVQNTIDAMQAQFITKDQVMRSDALLQLLAHD